MTRRSRFAFAGSLLAAGLAAALVPLRHDVCLERDAANPIQHLRLTSRSLLGLARPAWGARVTGTEAWGDATQGFFLAPQRPATVEIRAFPGFHRSLAVAPTGHAAAPALADAGDREALRRWFVGLLEQQLDGPSPAWEPAQRDCAGLLRFAFREAWGPHTEAWKERVGWEGGPVAGEPSRALASPWRRAFLTDEGWRPFAKGALLRRLNCEALGRDPVLAKPGDLIFFARGGGHVQPDHAMAFVRPDADGMPVLLYHTGPEGSAAGEVRRVRLDDLQHHPDPDFRPVPDNPAFLGVYRWTAFADTHEGSPRARATPAPSPLVLPHSAAEPSPATASAVSERS